MIAEHSPVASQWIRVNGLNIHYKCLGTGPVVVLLHGGANDWHEWQKNIAFFARRFRVYALDLPGFGLSESPEIPVTPHWFSSFLRDFIEALSITDIHLIGHSLGGTITLAFALDYPEKVKKAVIIDSGGLGELNWKGRLLLYLIRAVQRLVGKQESIKCKFGGTKEDWWLIDHLHKLKPPVMIVWGKGDPYLSVSQAKLAQDLIPNCQLCIFPSCRHAPQKESSNKFNDIVYKFLTE